VRLTWLPTWLLALALPAAGVTFVQSNAMNGSGASGVVTLGTAPAAGDVLMVLVGNSASITVTGVTGAAASYARLAHSSVNRNMEIWCGVATSGSAVTVNLTGSAGVLVISVVQFHNATCTVDGSFQAATGSVITATTGTVTTTNSSDLVIGAWKGAGNYASGPTAGFTGISSNTAFSSTGAYLLNAGAGSYSTSWGLSGASVWDAVLVAVRGVPQQSGGTLIVW